MNESDAPLKPTASDTRTGRRLQRHFVTPVGEPVSFTFDGEPVPALAGETVAAALAASGRNAIRQSDTPTADGWSTIPRCGHHSLAPSPRCGASPGSGSSPANRWSSWQAQVRSRSRCRYRRPSAIGFGPVMRPVSSCRCWSARSTPESARWPEPARVPVVSSR